MARYKQGTMSYDFRRLYDVCIGIYQVESGKYKASVEAKTDEFVADFGMMEKELVLTVNLGSSSINKGLKKIIKDLKKMDYCFDKRDLICIKN